MSHQSIHPAGLRLEVPACPDSVGLARDAVRNCNSVPRAALTDLTIIVSELMTNAVTHAGLASRDRVLLDVTFLEDSVRVEVTDSGPGFDPAEVEAKRRPGRGGWGLLIVATLCRAWGVDPGVGVVWADMAL